MMKRGGGGGGRARPSWSNPHHTTTSSSAGSVQTTSSDGDIQTIRSAGFSFGPMAPSSTVSTSTQMMRDQQHVVMSLGGMQQEETSTVGIITPPAQQDIEVGYTASTFRMAPPPQRTARSSQPESNPKQNKFLSSSRRRGGGVGKKNARPAPPPAARVASPNVEQPPELHDEEMQSVDLQSFDLSSYASSSSPPSLSDAQGNGVPSNNNNTTTTTTTAVTSKSNAIFGGMFRLRNNENLTSGAVMDRGNATAADATGSTVVGTHAADAVTTSSPLLSMIPYRPTPSSSPVRQQQQHHHHGDIGAATPMVPSCSTQHPPIGQSSTSTSDRSSTGHPAEPVRDGRRNSTSTSPDHNNNNINSGKKKLSATFVASSSSSQILFHRRPLDETTTTPTTTTRTKSPKKGGGTTSSVLGASSPFRRKQQQQSPQRLPPVPYDGDDDNGSSSQSERATYDFNPVLSPKVLHDDDDDAGAADIASLDRHMRNIILQDCSRSSSSSDNGLSKANDSSVVHAGTVVEEEEVEMESSTMIDSLETEVDPNSKQASLDYYNYGPGHHSSSYQHSTSLEREGGGGVTPTDSFLTVSTRNTEARSVTAEVGSKTDNDTNGDDDVQTIEYNVEMVDESRKKKHIPFILPNPTQSTGAPSSSDNDSDAAGGVQHHRRYDKKSPLEDTDDLSTRNVGTEASPTANQFQQHRSTGRMVLPHKVSADYSDKDTAPSFDFSVNGNLSSFASPDPKTGSLTSLDIAMERGRSMAYRAQQSMTLSANKTDRSHRQRPPTTSDIPITIIRTPPVSSVPAKTPQPPPPPPASSSKTTSPASSATRKVPATATPKVGTDNSSQRRRKDRCICIWVVLLCTLVMVGATASALCGLGKCQALNLTSQKPAATTTVAPTELDNGQTTLDPSSPIGPTEAPTKSPVAPLTIRDPPLPNDTVLPIPPTGPPTSRPVISRSQPLTARTTSGPTGLPTERPIPVPTTSRPSLAPQTFPVFIIPTNVPVTRNPTQSPTSNPTRRPTPNPTTPDPTTAPIGSRPTFVVSTRDAMLAAIDVYLDGGIDFPIGEWDVSQITDFTLAFSAARNPRLAAFNEDLTYWDTSKATSMRRMFLDAESFNGDISNFDTSNVVDMQEMFGRAENFSGDLSRWDVSKVTTMNGMFRRAAKFNSDISRWNTGSVVDMTNMFLNCALFNQDISSWDVSSVTSFAGMFRSALSFNRDLRWNTLRASDMATMFMEASSFNGDLSSFSTGGVTSMDTMFYYASSFEGKGLESWDTSSVVVFDRMFSGAISFRGGGLSNWNVGNAQFMDKMFAGAELFSQDLCAWRESLSPSLEGEVNYMFAKTSCLRTDDPMPTTPGRSAMCVTCLGSLPPESPLLETPLDDGTVGIAFSSRTELRAAVDAYILDRESTMKYGFPMGNWDVSQIRDLSLLFSTVRNPAMVAFNADLSGWDVTSATDTSSMFEGAISFTDSSNGLANWNTANVRDMSRMFAYSGFTGDVAQWDVSRVTSFDSMFHYAFGFRGDVSNWNVGSGTAFGWMFRGAVQFNSDLSRWSIGSASDLTHMFAGARLFNVNLCSWSSIVGTQNVDTRGMFAATSCPSTLDPSVVGSWCVQC